MLAQTEAGEASDQDAMLPVAYWIRRHDIGRDISNVSEVASLPRCDAGAVVALTVVDVPVCQLVTHDNPADAVAPNGVDKLRGSYPRAREQHRDLVVKLSAALSHQPGLSKPSR